MAVVLYSKENNIGIITINRPEALNALNSEVLVELNKLLDTIENDNDLKVLVITGAGRSFVAGADIKEMKDLSVTKAKEYATLGLKTMKRIEELSVPVIAAVNGFALGGGCELSLACEIRYASEKAKFGQPEVGLGITPGFGGTQRLPRLIGLGLAKELIYTGAVINAEEALRIGLVNKVCSPETLMDEVMKLATKIAMNSNNAVKFAKSAINNGINTNNINDAVEIEKNIFALCFDSTEQTEGMTAFTEKRKPKF